jgi:hypothetical protein
MTQFNLVLKFINLIFFDKKWYLSTYSDVLSSGIKPRTHFNQYGWKEGRYTFTPLRFNKIKLNIEKSNVEKLLDRNENFADISFEEFIRTLKLKSFPRL